MKILLSILCGTIILFVGGCVMSFGGDAGPIAWLSWAIVAVNLLMITAMWGLAGPMRVLFVVMAIADFALAALFAVLLAIYSSNSAEEMQFGLLAIAAFALKGGLSLAVSRRTGPAQNPEGES